MQEQVFSMHPYQLDKTMPSPATEEKPNWMPNIKESDDALFRNDKTIRERYRKGKGKRHG